ncbi:MAG: hypothetical protein RBU45_18090 [Myxococcota bacterium]|nr:hypothetical protein [Myxococcota bacterium]
MRRTEPDHTRNPIFFHGLASLILLAGAPALAAPPGPARFPEELRQEAVTGAAVARRLEVQESFPAAAIALRQAVQADPLAAVAARALFEHLLWTGDREGAATAAGALTRSDPYGAEGYALLGLARLLQGQEEGIPQLQKALEMDPGGAAARVPIARLARAAGELPRAGAILDGIDPTEQQHAAVLRERASLLFRLGRDDEAGRLLDALAALPEGGALAAAELALGQGRCELALPRLLTVADREARAEALRSLGWGLLTCGRRPLQAAGAFSRALQLDRDDEGARIGLAWALLATGEEGEPLLLAARWLDEVLTRDPAHPGALLARAEAARRQGDLAAAEGLLLRVAVQSPAAAEATQRRAGLLLQREDPYGAVALLRPLAEARPDLPMALANLMEALRRAGKSGEARTQAAVLGSRLPGDHPLLRFAEQAGTTSATSPPVPDEPATTASLTDRLTWWTLHATHDPGPPTAPGALGLLPVGRWLCDPLAGARTSMGAPWREQSGGLVLPPALWPALAGPLQPPPPPPDRTAARFGTLGRSDNPAGRERLRGAVEAGRKAEAVAAYQEVTGEPAAAATRAVEALLARQAALGRLLQPPRGKVAGNLPPATALPPPPNPDEAQAWQQARLAAATPASTARRYPPPPALVPPPSLTDGSRGTEETLQRSQDEAAAEAKRQAAAGTGRLLAELERQQVALRQANQASQDAHLEQLRTAVYGPLPASCPAGGEPCRCPELHVPELHDGRCHPPGTPCLGTPPVPLDFEAAP